MNKLDLYHMIMTEETLLGKISVLTPYSQITAKHE